MLRNNTDVRRCSYFELGLPVVYQPNNTLFINYKKTFVRVQDVNNKHCYRKSDTLSINKTGCSLGGSLAPSTATYSVLLTVSLSGAICNCHKQMAPLSHKFALCRLKIFRLVLLTAPFSNSKLKKFLISRLMANLVSFSCDILGKLLNCPRYLHEKLSLLTHERSFQRYFKPISLLFLGQSA